MSEQPVEKEGLWYTPDGKVLKYVKGAATFSRCYDRYLYVTENGEHWILKEQHDDDDWSTAQTLISNRHWTKDIGETSYFSEFRSEVID